jgi:DNA-binding IclR family transcriptional regulator
VAPTPFTSSVNVGTRLPAHATVLGRVLLADLSLAELRHLYPEPQLESFSKNTPRTVEELFEMVQRDREQGYVLEEGFFEANISTIASPVLDRAGKVVAALGTTVPSPRIEPSQLDSMIDKVRAAAGELSYLLDYRPVSGKVVNLFRE